MGISTEGYEFLCFPKKLILDTIFQTSLSSNARNRIIEKIRCSLGSILDTKVLQQSGIWGNIYEEIDNSFCNLAEWNHTVSYHLIFRNYCCKTCKYNWPKYLTQLYYYCLPHKKALNIIIIHEILTNPECTSMEKKIIFWGF